MKAYLVIAALSIAAAVAQADGLEVEQSKPVVIGAHLYTYHSNAKHEDSTAGLYAIFPVGVAGGQLTAGLYRNSIANPDGSRRYTFYVGQSWEWERWGLMAAVATGYKIKRYYGRGAFCPPEAPDIGWGCWRDKGLTKHPLALMIAPSVKFPEAKPYIGATPRLTLLPSKHIGVHLSVEREF